MTLGLIESYTVRRAICGYQTRSYWAIFANLACGIGDKHPLQDLKVALVRHHENYRFPSNEEFGRQLKEADLFGLRICRHLLEGLENYDTKEPTDTSSYSIEHIIHMRSFAAKRVAQARDADISLTFHDGIEDAVRISVSQAERSAALRPTN